MGCDTIQNIAMSGTLAMLKGKTKERLNLECDQKQVAHFVVALHSDKRVFVLCVLEYVKNIIAKTT